MVTVRIVLINILPILSDPCSEDDQPGLSSEYCTLASFEESLTCWKFQRTDEPALSKLKSLSQASRRWPQSLTQGEPWAS